MDLPVYFAFKGQVSGLQAKLEKGGGRCHPQRDWYSLEEMGHSSNGLAAEGIEGKEEEDVEAKSIQ